MSNTKKLIYISGPYSKPEGEQEKNVRIAITIADDIQRETGLVPFIPHLCHYWEQHSKSQRKWEDWMNMDFTYLDKCDCLFRIEGESKGADLEVDYAKRMRIPVFNKIPEIGLHFNNEQNKHRNSASWVIFIIILSVMFFVAIGFIPFWKYYYNL
jgi:hypothetical protein